MNQDMQTITIEILNKTLQARCAPDKAQDLQKAAKQLDAKLREINDNGKAMNEERMIIMAAIQVIYDLMMQHNQKDIYIDSLSSRVRELQNKITAATAQPTTVGDH